MPDPATMEKLAQALGMPVAYFHATNDLVAETLLVMSRLEPEQQRELLTKVRDYAQSRGVAILPSSDNDLREEKNMLKRLRRWWLRRHAPCPMAPEQMQALLTATQEILQEVQA